MNRPTDSVRIALFNRNNPEEFLVVTESDDPDNWKLPGGKFNSGTETPLAAAEREILEEVGVRASSIRLTNAGELLNKDGISARYIFAALATPTELAPTAELSRTKWVTTATVPGGQNTQHILTAVQLAKTMRSSLSAG